MKRPSPQFTEDQKYCIEVLALWTHGHHHLPVVHPFGDGVYINGSGDLSTFDFDKLTYLVLLAHRYAVRIEIAPSGPGLVRVIAHRRGPDQSLPISRRHPGLSQLRDQVDHAGLWPDVEIGGGE